MFYEIRLPTPQGQKSLMINLDHVAAIGNALFPAEGRPYGVWMVGRDVLGQVENFTVTPTEYQEICDSLPVVAWRDQEELSPPPRRPDGSPM